jgi:hypothetical protein
MKHGTEECANVLVRAFTRGVLKRQVERSMMYTVAVLFEKSDNIGVISHFTAFVHSSIIEKSDQGFCGSVVGTLVVERMTTMGLWIMEMIGISEGAVDGEGCVVTRRTAETICADLFPAVFVMNFELSLTTCFDNVAFSNIMLSPMT